MHCHVCEALTGNSFCFDIYLAAGTEVLRTFNPSSNKQPGFVETRSVAICDECLANRCNKRATVSLGILIFLVVILALHIPAVLASETLSFAWKLGKILPVVVVASFAFGFCYDGMLNKLGPKGLERVGQSWAYRILKALPAELSHSTSARVVSSCIIED